MSYLLSYAEPLGITLILALASIPMGFVLAVLVTLWRRVGNPLLAFPAQAYVYFFRGTPLFIQLYLVWFGGRNLFNPNGLRALVENGAPLWWIETYGAISSFFDQHLLVGILVLGLNTTAYTSEILNGAIDAVPVSNLEAAKAYGFGKRERFLRFTFPLALRNAWPAYTNEVIFLTHATALVYAVLSAPTGFGDLFRHVRTLGEGDFNLLLHLPVAMAIYLALSLLIFAIFSAVEHRWSAHLRPPSQPRRWFWPRNLVR